MYRSLLMLVVLFPMVVAAQPVSEAKTMLPEVTKAIKALQAFSAKPTENALKKIQIKGSSKPSIIDTAFDWAGDDRIEQYIWKTSLKLYPLGTPEQQIQSYYDVINAGLDSLYPASVDKTSSGAKDTRRVVGGTRLMLQWNASKDFDIYNGVFLNVSFTGKTPGIKQLMVDSIKRSFYRAVDAAATRKDIEKAREAFSNGIQRQNFPWPLPSQIYTQAVKEKAYNNADLAADMLLNYPFFVDKPKELINLLNADVVTEVRVRFKKIVDDYNAYMESATTPTQSTASKPSTSSTTTPSTKKKIYANACEEEMDGLKHKVGDYVVQGGKVALVTAFDCATDKYMIAWIDKSKDKAVVEIVMKDVITNGYTRGSTLNGLPFICSACNGFGYVLERETKQMFNNPPGTLTVLYTTGKVDKVGCGTCRGKGHIKSK